MSLSRNGMVVHIPVLWGNNMKEAPRFDLHEVANDFVNKTEDEWVTQRFVDLEELKERAEGSNTTQAWNEYEHADDVLSQEIKRLTPPDIRDALDNLEDTYGT